MRQVEKKKKKDRVAAALMLCFCLIALTSFFTIKASIDKVTQQAGDVPVTNPTTTEIPDPKAKAPAKEKEENVPLPEETPSEEVSAEIPVVDSHDDEPETTAFISPIDMASAKATNPYSMDMVIYNLTLDQYMTHPGIDFEAPSGSGVKAAADGIITDICEDDAYGTTIEITHADGMVSRYCNLSTDRLVEKGDTIKQGQVISNVGKTALYESMEKTHLHFELRKDGELVDPQQYISF